jgi:hypothetical protein
MLKRLKVLASRVLKRMASIRLDIGGSVCPRLGFNCFCFALGFVGKAELRRMYL